MQTLLHLQPRLAEIQRQRVAQGVEGPDLTQVTSLAALLPSADADAVTLHLRRLDRAADLPPFHLERMLDRLGHHRPRAEGNGSLWSWRGEADPLLASASQRASLELLAAAEPLLTSLDDSRYPRRGAEGGTPGPITRLDIFQAGLSQGTDVARILDAHLLAPIRQDNLAPGDPFVQTTLYVVAPLFEPLTSALIWPTLIHLLNYVGRRHISQIVGIFAVGSYAQDQSRALEDAASYASLVEMEALTGLHPNAKASLAGADLPAILRQESELGQWLGRPLFDRRYLLDREKANQGLVTNSFELTALTSNALEALVTTDAALHVEEQLGIDLRNGHERPYSLMGAATDYVPLDFTFRAVYAQEEKRLVQETLLAPAEGGTDGDPGQTLTQLGLTQEQILARLVAQMPDLFVDAAPATLADLAVHRDFILPPALAAEMNRLPAPDWSTAAEQRLTEARSLLDQVAGTPALDSVWGIGDRGSGIRDQGSGPGERRADTQSDPQSPIPNTQSPISNPQSLIPDPRSLIPDPQSLLSTTLETMRRQVVERLAASPTGLGEARAALAAWQRGIAAEHQRVASALAAGQQHIDEAKRQLALRRWQGRYAQSTGKEPSFSGWLRRTLILLMVALAVAAGYVLSLESLQGRGFDPTLDGPILGGIGVGALLLSLLLQWRQARGRANLRRQRLLLAQDEFSALLRDRVQRGLLRLYEALDHELRTMAEGLEQSCDALSRWAKTEGMPLVPPDPRYATHLYVPHISKRLWELCQEHLRNQADQEGRQARERLAATWSTPQRRRHLEHLLQAQTFPQEELVEFLQEAVQQAVAEINDRPDVRQDLVRTLAQSCNLGHIIWRDPARQNARWQEVTPEVGGMQNLIHRYLEALRSNAKPAANYEVGSRLNAHGIPVDFAAVDGRPGSDLTDSILREFRAALAATSDPFRITYVCTVHGLTLSDLDSARRYRLELSLLPFDLLRPLLLGDPRDGQLYRLELVEEQQPDDGAARRMWT